MLRTGFIIIVVVLFSCSGSKQNNESTSEQPDTLVKEDRFFHDFIYDFMIHEDFQLSRIRIDIWEYKNFFSERDYSLHIYPAFEIPEKEFEKDIVSTRYLTMIDISEKLVSTLQFTKEKKNWYLTGLQERSLVTDSVLDFETFLYKFSSDTNFTKNHIRYPFKYSYADPENDYADSTKYLDSLSNLKFNFFEKGRLLYFHTAPKIDGKKIMIFLRGLDNGLNIYYYFQKEDDMWVLTEENDYST